jgi:hypothetical protein
MYIPVIFFCLLNGNCNFWTADLLQNKKDCEVLVMAKLVHLDGEPAVAAAEGVCLQVKIRQI